MADALVMAAQELEDGGLLEALTTVLSERLDVLISLVHLAAEKSFLPASVIQQYRYNGHIKSYNPSKGYGFIECPDLKDVAGGDVFLHGNKVGSFQIGDEVNFAALLTKDGKLRAFDLISGKAESNGSVIGTPVEGKGTGAPAWTPPAAYRPALGKRTPFEVKVTGPPAWTPPAAFKPAWGEQSVGKAWGKQSWEVKPPARVYVDVGKGCGSSSWDSFPGEFGKGKGKDQTKGKNKDKDPKGRIATCFEMPGVTDARFEGQVKNFNEHNGYGFISSEELSTAMGEQVDAFLHKDEIGAHAIGSMVSFSVILSKNGRPRAQDVREAGAIAKWQRIR